MNPLNEYATLCDTAEQLRAQGRLVEAIRVAHQACAQAPARSTAYLVISSCLIALGDPMSALETAELAWLIGDNDGAADAAVVQALVRLRHATDPLSGEAVVVRPIPELTGFAFYGKACLRFLRLKRMVPAGRAVALAEGEQSDALVRSAAMNIDASLCQWHRFPDHVQVCLDLAAANEGRVEVSPLMALHLVDDPALHLKVAQKFIGDTLGHQAVVTRKPKPMGKPGRRPRIGYLSADFHDHATSRLMVALLEQHDRSAWEISCISYGRDDGSSLRQRVVSATETFIDIHGKPVSEGVNTLRALGLDVLVDAKGFTSGFEAAYTLARPAPVVTNFLAYPGSMGSTAYDYIVGDRTVTPFEHQGVYTECIVQLPGSYQCNDPKRGIPGEAPMRAELGLPAGAVVFAAFNNTKKITPTVFSSWMRILTRVDNAVLWLICGEEVTRQNLRGAAMERGVSPERILFAETAPPDRHMARHLLADVFLDTFPYNAHTTASDALWMGLPVVTMLGKSFAARVAASLLHTLGLPELVSSDLDTYEDLAVRLARDAVHRQKLRTHLIAQRSTNALYDAHRYAANLEQAFSFMIDRARRAKPPISFEVQDRSLGGGVRLAGGTAFKPVPRVSR